MIELIHKIPRMARRLIFPTKQEREVRRYWEAGGDPELRFRYQGLGPASTIVDVGGYLGQWTSDMVARYNCKALVFEPVKEYADAIRTRFARNAKITVMAMGLGDSRGAGVPMTVDGECSSVFEKRSTASNGNGRRGAIDLLDVAYAFGQEWFPRDVDVMSINCEGGEYAILGRLLEAGGLDRVRELEIQFHDFVPAAKERRDWIREHLKETHDQVYCYPFVWEHWRRR